MYCRMVLKKRNFFNIRNIFFFNCAELKSNCGLRPINNSVNRFSNKDNI